MQKYTLKVKYDKKDVERALESGDFSTPNSPPSPIDGLIELEEMKARRASKNKMTSPLDLQLLRAFRITRNFCPDIAKYIEQSNSHDILEEAQQLPTKEGIRYIINNAVEKAEKDPNAGFWQKLWMKDERYSLLKEVEKWEGTISRLD